MDKKVLALLLFIVPIGPVFSDMFSDSPNCFKPSKPFEFQDEWEYQNFLDEVETYKRCMQDFIEEQQEAAQNHLNAAEEATDEWNRFVNFEL